MHSLVSKEIFSAHFGVCTLASGNTRLPATKLGNKHRSSKRRDFKTTKHPDSVAGKHRSTSCPAPLVIFRHKNKTPPFRTSPNIRSGNRNSDLCRDPKCGDVPKEPRRDVLEIGQKVFASGRSLG